MCPKVLLFGLRHGCGCARIIVTTQLHGEKGDYVPTYPAYIQLMLTYARAQGQWYCGQPDAAALCFDILAQFPEHDEASALVYELFCDPWLIYDTRNALQQQIDEWDDRPWQQRRRLALSLRFISRWEGWHDTSDAPGTELATFAPDDVTAMLKHGRDLLLEAYCLGDETCTDMAWPIFVAALRRTAEPQRALLWVGRLYADLGFFADAAEVLGELCRRFGTPAVYRLLAEVRWWRDNAHRLPWLPPAGDGTRYRRMMALIDPNAPGDEQIVSDLRVRAAVRQAGRAGMGQPVLAPEVAQIVTAALPEMLPTLAPTSTLVDWSFLDCDDGLPGELPEWARNTLHLFGEDIPDDIIRRYRWSRPITKPATPPRYNPTDTPHDLDNLPDDGFD